MVLVIGGAFQGKLDYVRMNLAAQTATVADGGICTQEEIRHASVLNHFHLLVRRLLEEGKDPHAVTAQILEDNPELIIVSNELGYGVVPIEAFDRTYRETVGRVSCELAARAKAVHRVVCGLGQVIKE